MAGDIERSHNKRCIHCMNVFTYDGPITAAIVASVYPRSLATLAKLYRMTRGVTYESFDFLKSNSH
jgi:hypothetical protein